MSGPGFPGFAAGDEIKLAAQVAIDQNLNQYAITWGAKPFREATGIPPFPRVGRVRTIVTATHSREMLDRAVDILARGETNGNPALVSSLARSRSAKEAVDPAIRP